MNENTLTQSGAPTEAAPVVAVPCVPEPTTQVEPREEPRVEAPVVEHFDNDAVFFSCLAEYASTREANGAWMNEYHGNNLYVAFGTSAIKMSDELKQKLTHAAQYLPFATTPQKKLVLWYLGGNEIAEVAQEYAKISKLHRLVVFEPMVKFHVTLAQVFRDKPYVTLAQIGLGNSNRSIVVRSAGKSTSAFGAPCAVNESGCSTLQIREVMSALNDLGFDHSDDVDNVFYSNCEGCEVEVLEQLLRLNMARYFSTIHFATHMEPIPNLDTRACRIREKLSRTHRFLYGVPFAQERWQLRSLPVPA